MNIKQPTRAEGIERIRTLYAVLAGIPKEHTELSLWVRRRDWRQGPTTAEGIAHTCGSTACALGWAALYPPFNKLGLVFDEAVPTFGEAQEFGAGRDFFCLTKDETHLLFGSRTGPFAYDTPLWDACYRGFQMDGWSDKRIALHRLRIWLEMTDAITAERSAELFEIEKGY